MLMAVVMVQRWGLHGCNARLALYAQYRREIVEPIEDARTRRRRSASCRGKEFMLTEETEETDF